MAKFRKKPVVIDAIQFNSKESKPIIDFVENLSGEKAEKFMALVGGKFIIKTLEGDMTLQDKDYLIRRVNGEFYPCKPNIFDKTYEPA